MPPYLLDGAQELLVVLAGVKFWAGLFSWEGALLGFCGFCGAGRWTLGF